MNSEVIKRAGEIIAKNSREKGFCVLALLDVEGYPTASTISVSKNDGISSMTFCTGLNSNKTPRIEKCNRASVCSCSMEHNITLVGTIEIITDPDVKKEMWYSGLEGHFSGPEDPNYCVLMFKTERYNLMVDWKEAVGTL